MKIVYCSNCGSRLNVYRKALPKFGKIIDIVEFHECGEEVQELDLTPVDIPMFNTTEGKDKFVKKLNELAPRPKLEQVLNDDPGDRRDIANVKTTAPGSVIDMFKSLTGEDES